LRELTKQLYAKPFIHLAASRRDLVDESWTAWPGLSMSVRWHPLSAYADDHEFVYDEPVHAVAHIGSSGAAPPST
jgi:hypothetical protein